VSGQLALAVGLIALVLLIALTAVVVLRRSLISRRGGIIECWLRHAPGEPWLQGLAEYRRGQLYWHRSMSLRLRPHAAFDRSQLAVLDSRPATPAEHSALGSGLVVLRCQALVRHRGRPADQRVVELGMSRAAFTGLLSWLESSPIYPIRRAS
jgi:Protein of unknown function (DUF2550)